MRDAYLQLLPVARRSRSGRCSRRSIGGRTPAGRSARRAGEGRRRAAITPARGSRSMRSGPPPSRSARGGPRAITPVEDELLRLSSSCPTSSPGSSTSSGPTSCRRRRPRAVPGDRRRSRAGRASRRSDGPAVFDRGRFLERSTRRPAPSRSRYAARPAGPARPASQRIIYEVDQCLLRLEADRLEERSDWNPPSRPRPRAAATRETMARLLDRRRQINEARRSLDRQIEQTRLLTRPTPVAAPTRPGRPRMTHGGH